MSKRHEEDCEVEMKEQMYRRKLASLKRQLQQLKEGRLKEYQRRVKKLDRQYRERVRHAKLVLQLETQQVERDYAREKEAAMKEFQGKTVELKENLIAELEEKKKKMLESEKKMQLNRESMQMESPGTRKLRSRPSDPVPLPENTREPAPPRLNYALTEEQIMEDLGLLNKLPAPGAQHPHPLASSLSLAAEPPAQSFEVQTEDAKVLL